MTVSHVLSFDHFNKIINQGRPVIVEFYASWCPLCKPMLPIFETLSQDVPGVDFYKLDVDAVPVVSAKYEVKALPRYILFNNAKNIAEAVGANPHAVLVLIKEAERIAND